MDDGVIKETNIRYIHHKNCGDVQIQSNGPSVDGKCRKLTLAGEPSDSCVMEKKEDNVVHTLRFLYLNFKRITPSFFNEFASVTRLEIGCPVSIPWTFRYLPYLDKLKTVRFGQQTFLTDKNKEDDDNDPNTAYRTNDNLRTLEIQYDYRQYEGLSDQKKHFVDTKIKTVLHLGKDYFPNLHECHLTVPKSVEHQLEIFLDSFPIMRSTGEKRAKYQDGFVYFSNLKTSRRGSIDTSAKNNTHSHNSNNYNHQTPAHEEKSSKSLKRRHEENSSNKSFSSSSSTNTIRKVPPPPPSLSGNSVIVKNTLQHIHEGDDDDIVLIEPTSSGIPPDYPEYPTPAPRDRDPRTYNSHSDQARERRTREPSPSLLSSSPPMYYRPAWKR